MDFKSRAGETDGRLFPIEQGDIIPGAVFRMVSREDKSSFAFADHIVQDVYVVDEHGRKVPNYEFANAKDKSKYSTEVLLARPVAWVINAGTTGPSIVTGVSTVKTTPEKLMASDSLFQAVVYSRGLVGTHTI